MRLNGIRFTLGILVVIFGLNALARIWSSWQPGPDKLIVVTALVMLVAAAGTIATSRSQATKRPGGG